MSEAVASNAPDRLRRWWHWLGIAWLLVLLALGAQQWQLWSQQSRIDTDILALLPQDAHDRLLSDVTRRIADGSSRQVVVLLGSKDSAAAKRAGGLCGGHGQGCRPCLAGTQRLDRRLV